MRYAHKCLLIGLMGLGLGACATDHEKMATGAIDVDQPQPCVNENVQLCLNEAMRTNRLRTTLTPAQQKQLLQQQMTLIEKMLGGEVPLAKPSEPPPPAAEPTEAERLQDAISALPAPAQSTQHTLEMPQVPDQSVVPEMPQ
jgi:hypothetical protein